MQPIRPATFDPTATTSGHFDLNLPNGGWLLIINDSPVGIKLSFNSGANSRTVPPTVIMSLRVPSRIPGVDWVSEYNLPSGQAAVSVAVGECFEPDEWTAGEIIVPLVRQVNFGNPAAGGSVSNLINDGNVAGTPIIESTQAGSSGSNFKADNSGNFWTAEWTGSALNKLIQSIANAAAGVANVILGKSGNPVQVLGDLQVNANITMNTGNQVNQVRSAGGGAAGRSTWLGTTDPAGSGAGEGDVWINA